MTTLIFLIEPRGKGRPRLGRYGVHTDATTRRYESTLAALARAAWRKPPLEGPLHVAVKFVFKPPARWVRDHHTTTPDADNLLKGLDSMNGILWKDDSQIVKISAQKFYAFDLSPPRIELEFEELPDTQVNKPTRKKKE
jgi:Holliday junction resolvase RusA-like endonuclease